MEKSHFQWTNFWGAGQAEASSCRLARSGSDLLAALDQPVRLVAPLSELEHRFTIKINPLASK
jgi:hypothetical protein